jgi:uncharacterized protein YjbI with pentapeptide repeats
VATVALGLFITAVVGYVGWLVLLSPQAVHNVGQPNEVFDLTKIALSVAAGVGGVVAIVVAFRKQRVAEDAHKLTAQAHELANASHARDGVRLLNERFATAAKLLGEKEAPAIRLAGVHAMARLADDWEGNRQMCIDVLCAYIRLPYDLDGAPPGEREVRATIFSIIRSHLRSVAEVSWNGCRFDFSGSVIDGGSLDGIVFTDGLLDFSEVRFAGARFSLRDAEVRGGELSFSSATVSTELDVAGLKLIDGRIGFLSAAIRSGTVNLSNCHIRGGQIDFTMAHLAGGAVDFSDGYFYANETCGRVRDSALVLFREAALVGGDILLRRTEHHHGAEDGVDSESRDFNVPCTVSFSGANLDGVHVDATDALLGGGCVRFNSIKLQSGEVKFDYTRFRGGQLSFDGAVISGGLISFESCRLEPVDDGESSSTASWLAPLERLSVKECARFNYMDLREPAGMIRFWDARLTGGQIDLSDVDSRGGTVHFVGMRVKGGKIVVGSMGESTVINLWKTYVSESGDVDLSEAFGGLFLTHVPLGKPRLLFADGAQVYQISGYD